MYSPKQIIIPNIYQLDQLPYLKQQDLLLPQSLTSKRMESLRNITHKYQSIFAKIFVYWPSFGNKGKEEGAVEKIWVIGEVPVISGESFGYLVNQMYQKQEICKQEWNTMVEQIQDYKQHIQKIIDEILVNEYQIRMSNKKNIGYSIYYSAGEGNFRMKASFKLLNFEVCSCQKKSRIFNNIEKRYLITCQAVIDRLQEKLRQKINTYNKTSYEQQKQQQIKKRIEQYYERELKKMDEKILELKLKYNFNLLRDKQYYPIYFIDGLDGKQLMIPIIGNKNKYCMYGHFIGYNIQNYKKLENSCCQYCGMEIKQIQQNVILNYLYHNIFNTSNNNILYCPEFNRFKIIKKYTSLVDHVGKLTIESKKEQVEKKGGDMNDQYQKNQKQTISQITYTNYMHFCLSLKNFYPMTKSRIQIHPQKQIQYVNYIYTIKYPLQQKKTPINKYYKQYKLIDPVRGKYCNHIEFIDLRLLYITKKIKQNLYIKQWIYNCPICHQEIKDSQIIYLKQTLVIIKYIRKFISTINELDISKQKVEKKKINKKSIRIMINNYIIDSILGQKKQYIQLQKLYHTLIDPYIPFYQYELGLDQIPNKIQEFYNIENVYYQNNQQAINQWFQCCRNQIII